MYVIYHTLVLFILVTTSQILTLTHHFSSAFLFLSEYVNPPKKVKK